MPLGAWSPPWSPIVRHHYLLSPSGLHIPENDIKMHRLDFLTFQWVFSIWCAASPGIDAMRGELAKWCSSRLIVLFLSSFNSGSLGIEFKWVAWRARHRHWIVVTVPSSAAGPSSLDANSELRTQAPMDQFFTHQLWSRVLIWPGPPSATADTGTLVWVMINISSLSVPLSGLSYDQHIPTQCPTHCLPAALFTHTSVHSLNHFPIVGFLMTLNEGFYGSKRNILRHPQLSC